MALVSLEKEVKSILLTQKDSNNFKENLKIILEKVKIGQELNTDETSKPKSYSEENLIEALGGKYENIGANILYNSEQIEKAIKKILKKL